MATFSKNRKTGGWRAQVCVGGTRLSRSLKSKAEARAWAHQAELDIPLTSVPVPKKTFGDLLSRYKAEVTPGKRGAGWETTRLEALVRDDRLAKVPLGTLDSTEVASWRDRRLQAVSAASVLREWNLLSSACGHAVTEWSWLKENPFSKVKRPRPPAHRDRIIPPAEIEWLESTVELSPRRRFYFRVLSAAKWAIETGMRAGEVVGLTWDKLDFDRRVARLDREIQLSGRKVFATKNGQKRAVPLSAEAIRIAQSVAEESGDAKGRVFGLTSQQLDAHWRALCADAGVIGLHFHDTRHTAITRLAKKLNVLELARMVGITDLKILSVYYNESAEEIARKL